MTKVDKPLQLRVDLTKEAAEVFQAFKKRKGISSDAEALRLLLMTFKEYEGKMDALEEKELLLLKIFEKLLNEEK
ncbi:MAG: hypothetical protein ACTSO7_14660 [Candidatus Heimdallarchaeota archaeon]